MSETAEIKSIHLSPVHDAHQKLASSLEERDGWMVPASYGDPGSEYKAVRGEGAGLIDLSRYGRIEVSGSEAIQFLNGLITNDVKALANRASMDAAFPNVQGRLLAFCRVSRLDDKFFIDTEAATHERVLSSLMRFTLAGDFRVTDTTFETACLSIQGRRAADIMAASFGEQVSRLGGGHCAVAEWHGQSMTILRATHTGEDGFDLFPAASVATLLWEKMVDCGAQPVGFEALEVLRIEAGIPRYGIDMDESRVVLETGLDNAVSFTKGCYVGQEIIARIHWRGHVAKRLAGLRLRKVGAEKDVNPGDKITSDNKEIGLVTSSVFSPALDRQIALGYVKYDYISYDKPVSIASANGANQESPADIVKLPFLSGSWYEEPSAPPSSRTEQPLA